jgi:hypothetical protein
MRRREFRYSHIAIPARLRSSRIAMLFAKAAAAGLQQEHNDIVR